MQNGVVGREQSLELILKKSQDTEKDTRIGWTDGKMDGWVNLCTKGYLMPSEAKTAVVFTASSRFETCYICLIGRGGLNTDWTLLSGAVGNLGTMRL